MHSLTSLSFPSRQQVGQLAARLAALLGIYSLLRSDGFLLSLVDRYGAAGRTIQYGQWVIQSAIFYGFGYWLFPRFLYRFRPFPLLVIILITYVSVYMANYAGFVWLHETVGFPTGYKADSDMAAQWQGLVENGPLGLLVSPPLFLLNFQWSFTYPALLLAFKGLYDNRSAHIKNLQLQQQNTQLELNYLKSQVNPHFLFNVLNSIYALTEETSPRAAQLVQQLSGLMRYALYETAESLVPLEKELHFIRDYVALEQTRHAKRLSLTLDLPDEIDANLQLAPFILITFVENAFKHGVASSSKKSWMRVVVRLDGTTLHMTVANSQPLLRIAQLGGLGLENVRRRLTLLYPDHKLSIANEVTDYTAQLVLPLSRAKNSLVK